MSNFGGHTRRDCTSWRNKNELPQFTPRQFLDERCALEGKKKNELPQVSPRQLLDERCALDKLCNYPKGRISNKVIGPVLI